MSALLLYWTTVTVVLFRSLNPMSMSRHLAAGIVVLALPVGLAAQPPTTFVMPKVPSTGGNSSNGNNEPGTGAVDFRGQWSYDQSEYPDSIPRKITRIRMRASDFASTTTTWTGGTYSSVKIMMSTATANFDLLTATFSRESPAPRSQCRSGVRLPSSPPEIR